MPKKLATPPTAYSYIRFSSAEQAEGDSLRRQIDATNDWCKRNGVCLDTSTTFRDLGRSAFRGQHRTDGDRHALAAFLKLVETGRVPRGSFLVIENLDRLSREHLQPALLLTLNLLQAGVRIVQLKPVEMVFDDKSETLGVMMMIVELSRGHSESAIKSQRVTAAWDKRRQAAREKGETITGRLPAWVKVSDKKRVLIQKRAKLIQRMFALAVRGYGLSLIVKKLTADGVETWGRGGSWSKAYVHKILTGRAVLGEYQPIRLVEVKVEKNGVEVVDRKRLADGDPIRDYYPAVVDETTWHKAQSALATRKDKRGRVGHKVASLFTGLLWDARTRSRMLVAGQTRGRTGERRKARVLVPAASMEGQTPSVSFPYAVFEEAVLALLKEVRPADVIGEEPEGESATLAGELVAVEQRLRAVEAELTGDAGDVPALVRAAKALDDKRQDLLRRLNEARQRESNPLSAAWAETQTLLDVAKHEDDRLRLRGLLRTIIQEVWVLVVPRRSHRLAEVQVHFAGGGRRDYMIHYWAAGYCREGGWEARSWRPEEMFGLSQEDLRDSLEVQMLEPYLAGIPFESMFGKNRAMRSVLGTLSTLDR